MAVCRYNSAMTPAATATLAHLRALLRPAALATLGGFRPADDPRTSWFGKGCGLAGEGLPLYRDKPMFPLLQIRIDELPWVPPQLASTALLVVFFNHEEFPFDQPHGDGWLIREYTNTNIDALVALPGVTAPGTPLPFPLRWQRVDDDSPGWEDAWGLLDLDAVNDDDAASHSFFYDFNRYAQTKVGGFPREIQHGAGIDDFVFQIGSEEKACWMWADHGIGYFFKDAEGWRWSCQFY